MGTARAVENSNVLEIAQGQSADDVDQVRILFKEYADWLGFDPCFHDFDQELAELPGEYAPPAGRLLLARREGTSAGCVGLRKLDEGICEMKRLYVRPAFRGHGIGRRLGELLIEEARRIGYNRMRLDTLKSMTAARALYESFGFYPIEPYSYHPIPGTKCFELQLGSRPAD